ncbi:hypothetical protein Cni_G21698 [Canna indica]|uniref:Uncharacterized protein n=1 Tax=Canna indica TaxID=4628 RepID=A0AAQ3QIY3_9LILI|nr:hypothetical protein Cni_G21698 [Canna indica]
MTVNSNSMNADKDMTGVNFANSLASIEKITVSNDADKIDPTYGPWVRVTRKPRRKSFQHSDNSKDSVAMENNDFDRGIDTRNNLESPHYNSGIPDTPRFTNPFDPKHNQGADIAQDSSLVNILIAFDSSNHSSDVNPKELGFSHLVSRVTPSLMKFNSAPNPKPLDKKSKDKGKSITMHAGYGKISKFEVNKNLANLDNLLNLKKKRIRNFFDQLDMEIDYTPFTLLPVHDDMPLHENILNKSPDSGQGM